jgi:hypothetical protein
MDACRVARKTDPYHMVSGANCMNFEMTKENYLKCGFDFYTMHPYAPDTSLIKKSAEYFTELPLVSARQKIRLDQLGIYTLAMQTGEEGEYTRFFVHVPTSEAETSSDVVLELAPSFGTGAEEDKVYTEMRLWVLLAVMLLLVLEWGWYYREQL